MTHGYFLRLDLSGLALRKPGEVFSSLQCGDLFHFFLENEC